MEAAYRAELIQGCPEAADDTLFYHAVVEACAYWALTMCEWIVQREAWYDPPKPMQQDRQWGIATLRQRAPALRHPHTDDAGVRAPRSCWRDLRRGSHEAAHDLAA